MVRSEKRRAGRKKLVVSLRWRSGKLTWRKKSSWSRIRLSTSTAKWISFSTTSPSKVVTCKVATASTSKGSSTPT